MFDFYLRAGIYFFCFLIVLFGMSALDFNRFIRQGKIAQAQILYFIVSCALAYLMGNFLMSLIYYFYRG
ncbi:MAG: DUF1146 domain-containing protein [Erysipelotrichaceae bacterium]|jgi:uncharacterized membrane protein YwzB|nr:DUF1146 domain-containing protein [Erysipelotrichaceae bacterium]